MLGSLLYSSFTKLADLDQQKWSQKAKEHVMLHGVDVTGSRFFRDQRVLEAVQFAAEAHAHQVREWAAAALPTRQ
jgi:hypothetical protein